MLDVKVYGLAFYQSANVLIIFRKSPYEDENTPEHEFKRHKWVDFERKVVFLLDEVTKRV